MVVREAMDKDAVQGCEVMRRSIAELCVADHKNDPLILGKWVGNKTPENFRAWMAQAGNSVLITTQEDQVLAVGSVTDKGQITLLYVSPDARFRGVSKGLLAALEQRAADRGCRCCTLYSTETARRFYLRNGYIEIGAPVAHSHGSSGYLMSKSLNLKAP
jgi:GNAT superfamily N-acetyltransferase